MAKRKWGDRRDGRRCHDVPAMSQILIDLKPKRSLGELHINQKMDLTSLVNYMHKIQEKDNTITYFHAFSTLFGKILYNRPLLNRFISNRHVYEHNDISLSFVMKVDFDDKSEEIMVIMPILEKDNIFTISKKIKEKVDNVRHNKDTGEGANKAIQILSKLPNILRVPVVAVFKLFDKWGILPQFLVKDNLYYSSMIVSNLGTFKTGGIYHNVTDFGSCTGIITIGEIREEKVNGKKKYYCEFGVTIDERIADGFYFIKSIKLMQYILDNPELLEGAVNEKVQIK